MVELGALSGVGAGIASLIGMIALLIVVLSILGVSIWFFLKQKKYKEYKCVIWEKDGSGHLNETYDGGGVFVDKVTHNKRFYLQKANVGLTADSIPYVPTRKGGKIVYLFKTGLKNFHFIKPVIASPSITLSVGEEDVNWGVNAYERQKKLFQTNLLLQYMPFIIFGFTVTVVLIMIIYIIKNFSVLKDVALAFQEAAKSLAAAKAGTIVV